MMNQMSKTTERKTNMKSHIFLASSILAVLTLLFASGLSSTAQQITTRPEQSVQQLERSLPEFTVQELDSEALRIKLPPECERTRPDVQTHDVSDNFNPPGTPLMPVLSPALTSFLTSHNLSPKGYDDNRVNKVFADSFKLRSCRVCYATLELRVRHYQDLWWNDKITVGAAPFNSPGVVFTYANIWKSTDPNTKPLPFSLPTSSLNSYLFQNAPWLDIVAQDDTDFDYARLSVWYY
jgi:hypothetical protein